MPKLECPLKSDCNYGSNGCTWFADEESLDAANALYQKHIYLHKEKMPQMKLEDGQLIDQNDWETFICEWESYKTKTKITVEEKHLELCLSDDITVTLKNRYGSEVWNQLNADEKIETVWKELSNRGKIKKRYEMRKMKQNSDQTIYDYIDSLRKVAKKCRFLIKCSSNGCTMENDFSEQMVLDQLVHGMCNDDIRKQVFSSNLDQNELLTFIINEDEKNNEHQTTGCLYKLSPINLV